MASSGLAASVKSRLGRMAALLALVYQDLRPTSRFPGVACPRQDRAVS